MKGDFSRSTFNRKKHYHRVLLQQGRALLDADWNEQVEIGSYLRETQARDMLGESAAPMRAGGFKLAVGADQKTLMLSAGCLYVDGILCENDEDLVLELEQALETGSSPEPGVYLAYLDMWERHITAIEEPNLREVALDGPETTTRTAPVWGLKLHRLGNPDYSLTPADIAPDWKPGAPATNGALSVRAEADATPDNCLYRVEVHNSGQPGVATFKWSRENGAIVGQIEKIIRHTVQVSLIGQLPETAFAIGQWVELSDEERSLRGEPGVFAQLIDVDGDRLTLPDAFVMPDLGHLPTIRRWDAPAGPITLTNGEFHLEHGIYVKFDPGNYYRSGDYWTFPTRALADSPVDWPTKGSTSISLPPHGIERHYCQLGILTLGDDKTIWTLTHDCRRIFPAITELTSFFYAGGDGQDVGAEEGLLQLRVGVANGQWPVAGARVKFEIVLGDGSVGSPDKPDAVEVMTNSSGLALCDWRLDHATKRQHQVKATLLNAAGENLHLPIYFNARLNRSLNVIYSPPKTADTLKGAETVQEALNRLDALKVNRAGDTIGGPLQVNDLHVLGTLTVEKEVEIIDVESHHGDVRLGDQDKDKVIVHGALYSSHSSGALQVGAPLHLTEPLKIGNPVKSDKFMVDVNGILNATELYKDGVPLGFGVSRVIEQLGHGFKLGAAIYFNPLSNKYELARSDAATTLGMFLVAEVKDKDHFTLLQAGYIKGLSGLQAGEYYYVSDRDAGALVPNETLSGINNPILYAISPTEGYVLPYQPSEASQELLKDYVDNLLIGSVSAFAMQTPPDGWLECNGQALSRVEYARLFNRIGTTFGAGNGATTFNVPDLRGEFVRGWDHGRGVDYGRTFGNFESDQMQGHIHKDSGHGHPGSGMGWNGSHYHWVYNLYANEYPPLNAGHSQSGWYFANNTNHTTSADGTHIHDLSIQSDQARLGAPEDAGYGASRYGYETRPRNIALLYCIKF